MKPTDYLDKILGHKKVEVDRLAQATKADPNHPLNKILSQTHLPGTHFSKALKGASAISVLTESSGFGGSLTDLSQVANALATRHPQVSALRKDFIIHRLQLAEAVLAGAKAVLLIVHALGKELKPFLQQAQNLGLEVLTEVHDLAELEIALAAEAPIIGINHRNLTTFEINLDLPKSYGR